VPKRGGFSASQQELRWRQGKAYSCSLQNCLLEHPILDFLLVGLFTVRRTENSPFGGMQRILIEACANLFRDGL